MAAAGRVLGQQDVAGADGKMLALARLEIERSAERDDELSGWRIVPGKRAARRRLLERNARGAGLAAQQVAACAAGQVDRAFLETGIAIVAGPYPHAAYHTRSPPEASCQAPVPSVGQRGFVSNGRRWSPAFHPQSPQGARTLYRATTPCKHGLERPRAWVFPILRIPLSLRAERGNQLLHCECDCRA